MDNRAMEPFGQALREFYRGDLRAECKVCRDDGYVGDLLAEPFFREQMEFSPIERRAIDMCRGQVLDIGAGAGCHSLALQQRGIDVVAIDVCSAAVDIMAERGVKRVRLTDVFELLEGKFDTLLMMMHGIGLVETLAGLDRFLEHAHRLTMPGGQILADSLDVRRAEEAVHLAYQEANRRSGRYFGEVRMSFDYKGRSGPQFGWLHVDPETLAEHARQQGWLFRIEYQTGEGDYLAGLTAMA